MPSALPNFFDERTTPWLFEDVVSFLHEHFEVREGFAFRVGDKLNSEDENQRAGIVLAYAELLDYTLNQVKALFSEHDHFAIALPETRKGRNIVEVNNVFYKMLGSGSGPGVTMSQVAEYFDIPEDVLTLKQ